MKYAALKTLIAVATALVATAAWPQQPFDIDPSFRFNAQSAYIASLLPLPDGDIIVSGQIALPGEWPAERLGAKLRPDGSIDPLFRTYPSMGGKITPWQDQYYCGVGQVVQRFFMDGGIDSSYKALAFLPELSPIQGGDYHVFPDGRVLVSGLHYLLDSIHGYVGLYGLIWFTAQGYLDSTRVHRTANGAIFNLFPLPDGKFLCSGYTTVFEGHALPSTAFRAMPDGALDTTFQAPAGYVNVKSVYALADGKLLIGGDPSYLDNGDTVNLMRLMPDGTVDPTFHIPVLRNFNPTFGGFISKMVTNITPLDDDKYIITGKFTEIDGQPRGSIALIDTDGNLLGDLFAGDGCGGYQWSETTEIWGWFNNIAGITQCYDGSYYIYGGYHGYDDGTTNDTTQRLISKLYGLNVGINEQQPSPVQALQTAPNPSAGSTVLSTGTAMGNAELAVHDASGRVVWQAAWPAGEERYTLPAGTLAPGAYVLRLSSGLRGPQPPQPQRSSATAAVAIVYTGRLVVMP
ncbi:MAG: T9SS type A sorting domain-containing protein [Flavobacteriales bacterium]|nr:T9SS type A sorting domain-containing protein [Flavobacteriales bacterium]